MQKVCIVVPCFNEEHRIDLQKFRSFINENKIFHFHFVNDGSTDQTLLLINKLKSQFNGSVSVMDLVTNVGKGEAVRLGVLKSLQKNKFNYIGFIDADLSTPLSELLEMYKLIQLEDSDIILGSRIKRLGANISRKLHRHFFGRIFATFASSLLRMPVYDTQCGAKIFKVFTTSAIFAEKFSSRWIFDVELLFRYKINIESKKSTFKILEYPLVKWQDIGNSKLRILDFIRVPMELIKIKRRYSLK